jgi:hypothetical protein
MQVALNLSNGVTDTLESTTILIYSKSHMGLLYANGRQELDTLRTRIASNRHNIVKNTFGFTVLFIIQLQCY